MSQVLRSHKVTDQCRGKRNQLAVVPPKKINAADTLIALLREEPIPSAEVFDHMAALSISERTLYKVRKELGIASFRSDNVCRIREVDETVTRRIAGYAKLAKLWEKNRGEALAYHTEYFEQKYARDHSVVLMGVYIDITGNKAIKRRPEMLRLLSDCVAGSIDLISVQTKGYLAANTQEFCYLLKFLFELSPPVEIVTEDADYHIDTVANEDNQRKELYQMADKYSRLNPEDYAVWKEEILTAVAKLSESEK